MFNNKKSKRGFSLVELMVVVAIMGTLAAIAIPAYNEYRRSAKKNAYKADLTSLHKGWLAFGVELDSFCERETSPGAASIGNVGMSSLNSSKLYGQRGVCEDPTVPIPACSCSGQSAISSCNALQYDTNSDGMPDTACGCAWDSTVANNSPGKHNFIGFGDEDCDVGTPDQVAVINVQVLGSEGSTETTAESACELGVSTYRMGVYGHVSGESYYGISINNNGVFSNQFEGTHGVNSFDKKDGDANCS